MELLIRTWAIVWKDLLIEARTKQGFNAMAFFAALILFLFSFAIGPDEALLRRIAGGLLWVGITFTGTLALSRTFQSEELTGGLRNLRLYPGEVRAIYLGKMLSNLVLLLLVEAILFPAAGVLFQLDLWRHAPGLAGIAWLGTLGFSVVGTFYAALTVHIRAREVMLPLLLFPALIPVLLGAVNATDLLLAGDPLGRMGGWVRLLVAFDVILFVVCTWIFPIVVEE
ncbi:MAG: heme exporter protein CcmB [Gemmatimonadota bacterium]